MKDAFTPANNPDVHVMTRDIDHSRVTVEVTRQAKPGEFLVVATESGYPPHLVVATSSVGETVRIVADVLNRLRLEHLCLDELLLVDASQAALSASLEAAELVTRAAHPSVDGPVRGGFGA